MSDTARKVVIDVDPGDVIVGGVATYVIVTSEGRRELRHTSFGNTEPWDHVGFLLTGLDREREKTKRMWMELGE